MTIARRRAASTHNCVTRRPAAGALCVLLSRSCTCWGLASRGRLRERRLKLVTEVCMSTVWAGSGCYSPPLPSNVVPAGSGGSNYVYETDIERVSDQEGHFRARFP